MLTNPILRRIAQEVGRRYKTVYKSNIQLKDSYNDLPSPHGSWSTHYSAMQRKYNMYLLTGIGMTIFSCIVLKEMVFFNYKVPDCPADKIDYSE